MTDELVTEVIGGHFADDGEFEVEFILTVDGEGFWHYLDTLPEVIMPSVAEDEPYAMKDWEIRMRLTGELPG